MQREPAMCDRIDGTFITSQQGYFVGGDEDVVFTVATGGWLGVGKQEHAAAHDETGYFTRNDPKSW